jgi:hypothetical protein
MLRPQSTTTLQPNRDTFYPYRYMPWCLQWYYRQNLFPGVCWGCRLPSCTATLLKSSLDVLHTQCAGKTCEIDDASRKTELL